MGKNIHEIRDPIHVFVRLDNHEREVLNSRAFQRLRHIHQLAMTYLVYPGATHRRFEHSLGVMELAGRVYDVITNPDNVSDEIRELLPQVAIEDDRRYWRRVLRMAALCHDLGHLPFSHAAEKELLPEGWDHERLTGEIIKSEELNEIWSRVTPPLRPLDIVKLAIGPKEARGLDFSDWEAILSEIIVGDAFGVDRMDYLLRDSHHIGVAYGNFDQYRLIDTLRILTAPPSGGGDNSREPALGVEEGGLQTAEALMFARYFMYSQVYFHPIRRVYDIHLKDFLRVWLPEGNFDTDVQKHLAITDNEVTSAFREAAFNSEKTGHTEAERIVCRKHFKVLYRRNPTDFQINPEAGSAIYQAAIEKFGDEYLRQDRYTQKGGAADFPVLMPDDRIESSLAASATLQQLPIVAVDYVFADRGIFTDAADWLQHKRQEIIGAATIQERDDG
ncbi:MAG: HD domain-containing protein [Syntrophobacteraceae bacterium]